MPAVTRIGDADVTHCSTPTRAQGSGNVFVNGIAVSRQGDLNTVHLLPGSPCPSHAAPIAVGSTSVFINGKGCGYVGAAVAGCTSVAQGSSNVFCGVGSPVKCEFEFPVNSPTMIIPAERIRRSEYSGDTTVHVDEPVVFLSDGSKMLLSDGTDLLIGGGGGVPAGRPGRSHIS